MGLARNITFKILYTFGVGHLLLKLNRKNNLVPVLVFHKIIPEYDEVWPGIHPTLFEEILSLLKKHYTILPLTDLYSKPISDLKNACFLTFDDGYKDYLDYAYPILKKHNAPSSLFVVPNQIADKGHIWTSTIIFFIKHYSFNEIKNFFNQFNVTLNQNNAHNYFALNLEITKSLCNMSHVERVPIINRLRQMFIEDNRIIEDELLSFNELRRLNPNLTQIASHSLSHPSFKKETSQEFIDSELISAKEILERELKREVNEFAFPFAKYNDYAFNSAKKFYNLCFTKLNDFVNLNKVKNNKDELHDLSRFYVHHDSAEEVFFLINGFHKNLGR